MNAFFEVKMVMTEFRGKRIIHFRQKIPLYVIQTTEGRKENSIFET